MRREEWLRQATSQLTSWVVRCKDASPFEEPYVSVGFPKGYRGTKGVAIGQCWDKSASADTKRAHVFVSPVLSDGTEVLSTLLHELVHASVGTACGHRKEFRKVALELGFEAPMTETPPGEELKKRLSWVLAKLGDYPHAALTVRPRGSVGSRMLKVKCPHCGYTLRTTRSWLEKLGPPLCPCSNAGVPMDECV